MRVKLRLTGTLSRSCHALARSRAGAPCLFARSRRNSGKDDSVDAPSLEPLHQADSADREALFSDGCELTTTQELVAQPSRAPAPELSLSIAAHEESLQPAPSCIGAAPAVTSLDCLTQAQADRELETPDRAPLDIELEALPRQGHDDSDRHRRPWEIPPVPVLEEQESLLRLVAKRTAAAILPVYSVVWLAIGLWDICQYERPQSWIPAAAAVACGLLMMFLRRRCQAAVSPGAEHGWLFAIAFASLAAGGVHVSFDDGGAPDYLVTGAAIFPIILAVSADGLAAGLALAVSAWAIRSFFSPSPSEFLSSAAALAFLWATASAHRNGRAQAYAEYIEKRNSDQQDIQRQARKDIDRIEDADVSGRQILDARGEMDGLWEWNLKTDKVYFSPRWRALLGYGDDASLLDSESWLNLIHPYDLDELTQRLQDHLQGKTRDFECEHRIQQKDGSYRWVLSRGRAVIGADGNPARLPGSQSDIKRMKDYERQLVQAATHDRLTGLPNRDALLEELTKQVQRKLRRREYCFGVAFIDLDGFKLVNDTLGHQAGDDLLVTVAQRIRAAVRSGDLVARLGGDEFVVVMPALRYPSEAAEVASRIQKATSGSVRLGSDEVSTGASIGVAIADSEHLDAEALMRNADLAMYQAKRKGKDRTEFFNQELSEHASRLFEIQNQLKHALKNGELELLYQPIVSIDDCRISGAEALIRWRRQDGMLVSPADFIPVAEESDLIIDIGSWVLETACASAHGWNQGRIQPLMMSVNLSARQLREPGFEQRVKSILQTHELQPSSLQLEITENVLVDDWQRASSTLEILSLLGVSSAIDDFGTGYSSLSYLRSLPCTSLKVDQSFVKDISTNSKASALAGSIIQMAHSLELNVIAEGVETVPQFESLSRLGCEKIQGYLASHPVDPDTFTELLGSSRKMEDRLRGEWWAKAKI